MVRLLHVNVNLALSLTVEDVQRNIMSWAIFTLIAKFT